MVNSLFQWLFTGLVAVLHPFFVSVIELNHNPKEKSVEISMRIFTDDFEKALRKFHPDVKIDILHPANQQQMNSFVYDYIQKHLQLQLNGKAVQMSFVGYEQQSESIWTYLEVKDVNSVQQIHVTNNLLYDFSESQINMLHAKANGKEHSYKLDFPATEAEFKF